MCCVVFAWLISFGLCCVFGSCCVVFACVIPHVSCLFVYVMCVLLLLVLFVVFDRLLMFVLFWFVWCPVVLDVFA